MQKSELSNPITKKVVENEDGLLCAEIIREFMKTPPPPLPKETTLNQTIYKEIRKTLGSVDLDFKINSNAAI